MYTHYVCDQNIALYTGLFLLEEMSLGSYKASQGMMYMIIDWMDGPLTKDQVLQFWPMKLRMDAEHLTSIV